MRYPDKIERRPDIIAAMRYPDKIERRSNIIAAVRYPDGMSENFCPSRMSDATCRKGPSTCPKEREPHDTF